MSAHYRYNITFGFEMEKAYRMFNKAFGCNMKNNSDDYIGDGFKLVLDGDIVFVYFTSIENREFVKSIIDKVADALCADPYYELYDEKVDTDVNLYELPQLTREQTSAYYRYNITFGYEMENAYCLLNKAFGCNLKNNTDDYIGDEFKFVLDGDIVFVHFKSIENREFVISIIDKVADTLCADRYYELYDEKRHTDVNLYDDESLPKTGLAFQEDVNASEKENRMLTDTELEEELNGYINDIKKAAIRSEKEKQMAENTLKPNSSRLGALAKGTKGAQLAVFGNGFTFTYDEKVIEEIEDNQYVEVYSNVVVVKSNNPKFKAGAKIEQISVSVAIHFEYADGREY